MNDLERYQIWKFENPKEVNLFEQWKHTYIVTHFLHCDTNFNSLKSSCQTACQHVNFSSNQIGNEKKKLKETNDKTMKSPATLAQEKYAKAKEGTVTESTIDLLQKKNLEPFTIIQHARKNRTLVRNRNKGLTTIHYW